MAQPAERRSPLSRARLEQDHSSLGDGTANLDHRRRALRARRRSCVSRARRLRGAVGHGRPRRPRAGAGRAAGARRARPHAPGPVRRGGVRRAAPRLRRRDRDAHGQVDRGRPHPRARPRGRRLPRQAVQPAGAGRARPRPSAPHDRAPRRGRARPALRRGTAVPRPRAPPGGRARRVGRAHAVGVQAAARARALAGPRLLALRAHQPRAGARLRRLRADDRRAREEPAPQDRAGPERSAVRADGPRRGVPPRHERRAMSRLRLSLMGRLAVTMATITIAAVALSMTLVYHSLDGRLNRLGAAHVESSAARVAAIAGAHYEGGWSKASLAELVERSRTAGFDITVTDVSGRPLSVTGPGGRPHRWTASAPVVVGGRGVGELELRPIRSDIFGAENRALRHQLNGLLEVCAGLALGLALLAAALIAATLVRTLCRLAETGERLRRGALSARAKIHGGAELEQLAAAFNQLASTLAREDESRRAAAADIAHELRTPVAGIVSRIEAAQDGVMADESANLEAMHAEALRLAHLIDDVGQLAEAERPDLLISHAELDLATTCAQRASAYEGFFAAKEIAFEVHAEAAPMHGDARRLEQVVDNLLSNALRYPDPGGRVELHVRPGVGGCVVEVRDTGIGIAPRDLPHVFDRFWRSDRSRSRATGGSGIGLAVVRELVRAHHGRVELRSELGHGTTARVVLPPGQVAMPMPMPFRAIPASA